MQEKISPALTTIKKTITIPGSKSITNRALLLAALAEGESTLSGILLSDDTRAFLKSLQNLGIAIELDEAELCCTVKGAHGKFPEKKGSVWCQDAGTAARFLLAACAASLGEYFFDATQRLRERPIATLLKTLCEQGARVEPRDAKQMPFTIFGSDGLSGGEIVIDGSESGQFISALLMVAPFAKKSVTLKILELVSKPFVEMTAKMMQEFGVTLTQKNTSEFHIPTPQCYRAKNYLVEPDLSTASYFFAAAAVTNGEIIVRNIQRKFSKQGDAEFLTALEKMGCEVSDVPDGIRVQGPKTLRGIEIDMGDFSDTFMTLATVAPFANSPTTISGIAHTRQQESDRIAAVESELKKLGIKVESGNDWIRIFPGIPHEGIIDSHNDHRIAMAFSIIGLRIPGIIIDGAECVAKTCPGFFQLFLFSSGT